MAADVSSLVRIMSGYKEDGEKKGKRDPITRDLLGGCALLRSNNELDLRSNNELDLDFQIPSGWERRLDLLSGNTYLQKRGSGPVHRQLHDLNLPPPPAGPLPDDPSALDLKLLVRSPPAAEYRSVCTLDKVKSALERAERESRCRKQQQRPPRPDGSAAASSPSSSSATTSSAKRRAEDEGEEGLDGSDSSRGMMAAGCPSCLLYVLISKGNPRCPRCDSHVPVPVIKKKRPRIDLNQSQ